MQIKHPERETSTRVKLCKNAEVNSEISDLWYGIFSLRVKQQKVSWLAPALTGILN